jgi:hypothetical protein
MKFGTEFNFKEVSVGFSLTLKPGNNPNPSFNPVSSEKSPKPLFKFPTTPYTKN